MTLRDAGWRVVNVACSLGRPGQHARREAELREACSLAGFELRVPPKPVSISSDCDPVVAREELAEIAIEAIEELEPQVVVSPGPSDRHPGHLLVAQAVRDVLAARGPARPRWWMWALWGSLPQPTLGTLFDERRLEEVLTALAAHRGEVARNDYRRFVKARAEMNAALATELLFGFGAAAPVGVEYVELLTEVALVAGRWLLGRPRWLDAAAPLCEPGEVEAIVD